MGIAIHGHCYNVLFLCNRKLYEQSENETATPCNLFYPLLVNANAGGLVSKSLKKKNGSTLLILLWQIHPHHGHLPWKTT